MMKSFTHPRTVLSLLATGALSLAALSAQSANTNLAIKPPAGGLPPQPPPLQQANMMNSPLTPDELAKLRAVHATVMINNADLQKEIAAAMKAMDDARMDIEKAMVKQDPSVAPLLKKIHSSRLPTGPPPPVSKAQQPQ